MTRQEKEALGISKYEELCEALVGDNSTERYTHEDIVSYVYNLKNIEEKFNNTKPKIDAVTLNLVNALKQMDDKLNEGSWEYINLGDVLRFQDVYNETIKHYDLKKEGGVHDYGADKGKYQQFYYSDYVCHTDPNAFDPSKVEEEDDEQI